VWVNTFSVYLTYSFVHSSLHCVVVHDGSCVLLPYVQCMWYHVVFVSAEAIYKLGELQVLCDVQGGSKENNFSECLAPN